MENAGEAFKKDPDLKHYESNCKTNPVPNSHQEKKPQQMANDSLGHHLPYCQADEVSLIFLSVFRVFPPQLQPTFRH